MRALSHRVALYPDHDAFPLWFLDEDGVEIANAGRRGLPISERLRDDLRDWARRWEENCDEHYGVADWDVERRIAQDAQRLAARVQDELGTEYVVTCYALDEDEAAEP